MKTELKSRIATGLMNLISGGNHPLWPSQVQVLRDIANHVEKGNEYGYVKRPTGTGKTVNYIAEIAALGMPALVITPRVNLTTQIRDEFLRSDLFDFDPEQIGVYHGKRNEDERSAALKAPVLITTFASYARLAKSGVISGKERPLVILDEVHHARGDVVRPLIRELFGDVYVQGWTATDTFVTGQNIGYYLFNGKPPIHVTTIPQAVANNEIVPYKNVIVETHLGAGVNVTSSRDYNSRELDRIVRETGRDEAAIRLFLERHDEETGLRFRDMKSIWYCAGVDHAERVAEKLTDIFGENYALAVSHQTPKKDLEEILNMHREGEIPILVNADLLIEGFDSPSTQLVMMLRPTRSPIVAEQTGGRVLRLDPSNPNKLAYVVTFVDEGMYDVVPFGAVAGNMIIMRKGEYRASDFRKKTDGAEKALDYYDFPEISGLQVHTSQVALDEFLKRRNEQLRLRTSRFLSPQNIAEIVAAHATYNGNASEATRHLPYTRRTIMMYWKEAGLKPSRTLRVVHRLNQQQIEVAYYTYGGNANEAAKNLGCYASTVLGYWRRAGFEIGPSAMGKNKKNQQQMEDIVAAYYTYGGNSSQAAKHLGYAIGTILKYWREAGLVTRTAKSDMLTQEQRDRIIAAHASYDGNPVEATKNLPHRKHTIIRYWENADLEVREPNIIKLSQEEIGGIVAAHTTYDGNAREAARKLGYPYNLVMKHWREAGLEIWSHDTILSQEEIDKIIGAYETYNGFASRAAQYLPYSHGTFLRVWKQAGLRTRRLGEQHRLSPEAIDEIVAAYTIYNGNVLQVSRKLLRTHKTVTKYWREAGLEIRSRGAHDRISLQPPN
ncbi:MAG: DEAD/DEAH box helicase family protein [Candidatus Aenigmarchaeota archaeon]|nr:DEAD/DEAH box helicase family protein [Candidatus Aenigmarchaeota archaeon]